MGERAQTISKNFKDDEIIGKLPNGDIYLKLGVKRKSYNREDSDLTNDSPYVASEETYINYEALMASRIRELKRKYLGDEVLNDEVDNWDTE